MYTICDQDSMHQLLMTCVPCFKKHWEDALNVVDRQPMQERSKLLITDIEEPLLLYEEHNNVHCTVKRTNKNVSCGLACVLCTVQ